VTVSALEVLVLQKLSEPTGTYYPATLGALNEAQRFFCLLTLCLEKTASFPLTAATPFYHVLPTFGDFLLPRRMLNSAGQRLRPAKLAELDALDSSWLARPGIPTRYVVLGLDLLAVYPQPVGADTLSVTYARAPVALTAGSQVPEIETRSHYALSNYAAYASRTPEGGQEFAKFIQFFNEFLDEAQEVQALVKERNRDLQYEKNPFELAGVDRSTLVKRR
jgi:hypothetical protein